MELYVVIAFLGLSLLAYVILGGADFGVGILESVATRRQRSAMRKAGEQAIAPIWEANHIWIILALVILFVAFPAVHVRLTTSLPIPLLVMLVGIILRGTAFTFRYYDLGSDPPAQKIWTTMFCGGSLLVPMIFGHLVAATSRGKIPVDVTSFWEGYIAPWIGWFPLATGLFVTALFAWLAAVFLVGEAASKDARRSAVKRARRWTAMMIITGTAVTISALVEGVPWLLRAVRTPFAIAAVCVAIATVAGLWRVLGTANVYGMRIASGIIVTAVLAGYWGAIFPTAIELTGPSTITWYDAAAPQATLRAFAWTLVMTSLVVLPGLAWLFLVFKKVKRIPDT